MIRLVSLLVFLVLTEQHYSSDTGSLYRAAAADNRDSSYPVLSISLSLTRVISFHLHQKPLNHGYSIYFMAD